jgi:acyl dehydratase
MAGMQFELEELGRFTDERVTSVGGNAIRAYAEATNDRSPAALAGRVGSPVFAIVPVWEPLQEAARRVAPEEARPYVVHGDQDMFLHLPIEAGMTLRSRAAPVGVHVKDSGTTVVLKTETRDERGRLLNEQYVTEFYVGVSGGDGGGETAPDHRTSEELARAEPEQEVTHQVDEDQTYRYAEASGDDHAIHLDDEAARGARLPGIVVHGLCLMAFAGRAVLEWRGEEDPAAVRRLAVRFSRPMRPGGALTTRMRNVDGGAAFAFDAIDGDGTVVMKDGLVELDVAR